MWDTTKEIDVELIQLSYNKRFGDHNVAAVAGVESIKRDTPTSWLHAIPTLMRYI